MSLLAGVLVAMPASVGEADSAEAANAWNFDPGYIISDGVFYNSSAMDESAIQAFLNSKVSQCRSGYTCVKDYRETTASRVADPMCGAYSGGSNESAARIIAKVSAACGINPQVLIVLLQKEQGLITDTWPTDRQYRSATGYGCPDTAPCDAEYYGFFNQVYKAAWAFKRYTQPTGTGPGTNWYSRYDLMYPVGQTVNIQLNPNVACGTQSVRIQNQATHSLYVYTPYVPNAAALNAGYGTGDSCSAYGNRNFYLYFTDWFGATKYTVSGLIATYWQAQGGTSGPLGEAVSEEKVGSGGRWQEFSGGVLTLIDGETTVRLVSGALGDRYRQIGMGASSIGLATGAAEQVTGGWRQSFQNGIILHSASGGWEIPQGPVLTEYVRLAGRDGFLGWPTEAYRCGLKDGGCYQGYQNGSIHWSAASGAHSTSGAIRTLWEASGWETGLMGYPTGDVITEGTTLRQTFQGGEAMVTGTAAAKLVPSAGPIQDEYLRQQGLGAPITLQRCGLTGGGCYQDFENGSIHWSPTTGAFRTDGVIRSFWESLGWETGVLGYPAGNAVTTSKGTWQAFQGGTVFVKTGGKAVLVPAGPILDEYLRQGGATGTMGWPKTSQGCGLASYGCYQEFENASIHWTASTGAFRTDGVIRTFWEKAGWENGSLGYPTANAVTTTSGVWQKFQNGAVFIKTGAAGVIVPTGPLLDEYLRQGGPTGSMGWPTSAHQCGLTGGGCSQEFEAASIHWSASTGAHRTDGVIRTYWATIGGEQGIAGYPTGDVIVEGSGQRQTFENGVIIWSSATGARFEATIVFTDVGGLGFEDQINWLAAQRISLGWEESDGTRTYRPYEAVRRDAMAAFLYRLAGSPEYTPPAVSKFADVPTSHEFYKEISWLESEGITRGWEEGGVVTYRPNEAVKRDAMAAFLYRFSGSPEYTAPIASSFSDINVDTLFYEEMSWLASEGISTGWVESDGRRTYRGDAEITREQMAAFMYRLAN